MNGSAQHERIREILDYCRDYWRRNGVPDEKVAEMEAELRDHLGEALADGKSVEDVVGRDVERFAEEWAAPNRPTKPLGEETLSVLADTVVALAVLGGLTHLVLWSAKLPADATGVLGALLFALLLARLFAYLRAPSDAPPGSEESVLDRYPRRVYNGFMWFLIAVWAVYLFLPLPDTVLFRWPVQATLMLPLLAMLIREAKRLVEGDGAAPPREFLEIDRPEDETTQVMNAIADCSIHWRRMRIPENQTYDMLRDLDDHIEQALKEGRSVRSVVGDDVEAFAEAWAEEHGAEPDHSPEPVGDVVTGWVLSFSACATVLAVTYHLLEWSLYVPVAYILGFYLFFVAAWFGQPVADLLGRVKSWRYSPAKSLLAAGLVVLIMAALAGTMAFVFVVVGPRIPFEWPWYATVVSALVALSVVFVWLWRFSREDAERERRRAERGHGSPEGA